MSSGSDTPAGEVVARFEVRRIDMLDAAGQARGPLPDFARDRNEMVAMYRAMVLARTFDEKAIALQRSGRLGTYASCLGEEAAAVGLASAMRDTDVLVPSYREQGGQLWRGVTLEELFLYWGGDERGSDFAGPQADFPVSIPVASHTLHAAGVALARQLDGDGSAVVCVCGDGATSKGDFYEALNLAGVWTLPVVFVVLNNEWAISVPRAMQSAAETLAQKAVAAGLTGLQVDGNDVIAVRWAVARALERARAGEGASVVEALTYRLGDHTTADDAARYRDDAEVSARWAEEPIARLRTYLNSVFDWARADEEALMADCASAVDAAADAYLAAVPLPPEAMFDHLFARLPACLAGQRAAVAGHDD